MSEFAVSMMITGILMIALLAWVPILHRAEALSRRLERAMEEDIPDLRDDDYSPHLSREAA